MKERTRKSTTWVSLVLVPLGLAGLGYGGGCDDKDSAGSEDGQGGDFFAEAEQEVEPANPFAAGPFYPAPETWPATYPIPGTDGKVYAVEHFPRGPFPPPAPLVDLGGDPLVGGSGDFTMGAAGAAATGAAVGAATGYVAGRTYSSPYYRPLGYHSYSSYRRPYFVPIPVGTVHQAPPVYRTYAAPPRWVPVSASSGGTGVRRPVGSGSPGSSGTRVGGATWSSGRSSSSVSRSSSSGSRSSGTVSRGGFGSSGHSASSS